MTDQATAAKPAAPTPTSTAREFAPRRSTDREVACAIDLGWRLAALYGLRPSELPIEPTMDLLPLRTSLPQSDRLQLELKAAAGDAKRVGTEITPDEFAALVELTKQPERDWGELRERIKAHHIALEKSLWADHEATGKAYELGNVLSDTWNRMVKALRQGAHPTAGQHRANGVRPVDHELREIFHPERVERIKLLLDDLQTRIDPAAVRIVKRHLDAWRERVEAVSSGGQERFPFEATPAGLQPLNKQTVIWRQLVTGDKEPEAYLERDERARVRDVMAKRMAQAFLQHKGTILRVSTAVALVTAAAVYLWDPITSFYDEHLTLAGAITAFVGSVAGALGLSTASIAGTVRKSLNARAELVWNTALAELVCEQTSCVDELLAAPEVAQSTGLARHPLSSVRAAVTSHLRPDSKVSPQP